MNNYPCPACGFLVFSETSGSYEICELCGWEDDHVQLVHPRLQGGANRESLVEAQTRALKIYPLEVKQFGDAHRDLDWRPLDSEETVVSDDAPKSGRDYFDTSADKPPEYYWRYGS